MSILTGDKQRCRSALNNQQRSFSNKEVTGDNCWLTHLLQHHSRATDHTFPLLELEPQSTTVTLGRLPLARLTLTHTLDSHV
jgi:hypothetical protein